MATNARGATAPKEDHDDLNRDKGAGRELVDPVTGELVAAGEFDYGDDIGAGFENQDSRDVTIPMLAVAQPGSPECSDEATGVRPGMILNRTVQQSYPGREGIAFIPALTEHLLVEWKPKFAEDGKTALEGGYVGPHAIDSDLARRVRAEQPLGTYKHPDSGNDLVETYYVHGVALDAEGAPFPATFPFSSTFIKPYKDWMFRARSIIMPLPDGRKQGNLPLFAHAYRIRTQMVEKGGNRWFVPVVSFLNEGGAEASRLPPSSELYQAAKAVRDAMKSGELKVDASQLSRERADDGTGPGGAPRAPAGQEDAPY